MWEGILAMVAFLTTILATVVAVVVIDEVTDLADITRQAVRGWTGRRSIASRVDELESRLTAAERRLARPA
jgi:hypothetical protein